MAGFASVMEGLAEVKSLLDVPFADPLNECGEANMILGKHLTQAAKFLADLRQKGVEEMSKKDTVSDLATKFNAFVNSTVSPNRSETIRKMQAEGGKAVHPLQSAMRSAFQIAILAINEGLSPYRDQSQDLVEEKGEIRMKGEQRIVRGALVGAGDIAKMQVRGGLIVENPGVTPQDRKGMVVEIIRPKKKDKDVAPAPHPKKDEKKEDKK